MVREAMTKVTRPRRRCKRKGGRNGCALDAAEGEERKGLERKRGNEMVEVWCWGRASLSAQGPAAASSTAQSLGSVTQKEKGTRLNPGDGPSSYLFRSPPAGASWTSTSQYILDFSRAPGNGSLAILFQDDSLRVVSNVDTCLSGSAASKRKYRCGNMSLPRSRNDVGANTAEGTNHHQDMRTEISWMPSWSNSTAVTL
nr:hypothetical protein CFP56_02981 [Quercus suber]